MIKIANQLQIFVLCEGVETAAQCKYLEEMGCYLVQGYYFSEPIPCNAFDKLLAQNHGMVPIGVNNRSNSVITDNLDIPSISKSALKAIPDGIVGFKVSNGQMLFVSASMSTLTKYSIKKLFTYKNSDVWLQKFIFPKEFHTILLAQRQLKLTGKLTFHFYLRRADGKPIELQMYARTMRSTKWGNYTLCRFIDITNQ